MYYELKRINFGNIGELGLLGGFTCFREVNPYEITPLLMKYFVKYYDRTIDKFYPLDFNTYGNEDHNWFTIDKYENRQQKLSHDFGDNFKKCDNPQNMSTSLKNCDITHIAFMNRNSVRLLDETDEEFELKILQHILYELQANNKNLSKYKGGKSSKKSSKKSKKSSKKQSRRSSETSNVSHNTYNIDSDFDSGDSDEYLTSTSSMNTSDINIKHYRS
jgi:hypothetical protein